ncbi:hypothetical protein D3C87_1396390 [compost metagenome]
MPVKLEIFSKRISKLLTLFMFDVKTLPSIVPLSIPKVISALSKFGSGIRVYCCANPIKLDSSKMNKKDAFKK